MLAVLADPPPHIPLIIMGFAVSRIFAGVFADSDKLVHHCLPFLFAVLLCGAPCAFAQPGAASFAFMPDQWPEQDLNRYLAIQSTVDPRSQQRTQLESPDNSTAAMIVGTSEPLAVHVGLEVLEHGGNAADAALTTVLAQVALTAGATVSYAGVLNAVYFDAAAGKVHTLNAGYNTSRNEKDPLSIPKVGEHSGRTALVPGFMAGVQALHERVGSLPFSALFGPAIWIAEHGVVASPLLASSIYWEQRYITRLPEGRSIFTKADGHLYQPGELFRQPALAVTLRKIAAQGSAYMYTGEWAHHFIDLIGREGGTLTLDDLASYRPLWSEPLETDYGPFQLVSLGPPNIGGVTTLSELKIAAAGELKKYGPYASSTDALYYLIQIERFADAFANMPAAMRQQQFPDSDPSITALLDRKNAERAWTYIQRRVRRPTPEKGGTDHTAAVIAVDKQGNVACILHSSVGIAWGATGIFVDGISVPDSAVYQQKAIAVAGPGARLPDPTTLVLALQEGKPVLASTAIGRAGKSVTIGNLLNILDLGMDPQTAARQPSLLGPFLGGAGPGISKTPESVPEAIAQGTPISQSVLDGVEARGQPIKLVPLNSQPGDWIGIQIDPEHHELKGGGGAPQYPVLVEGYSAAHDEKIGWYAIAAAQR
jgi:gamma-glutamyltranspeptidase/glutathione hydrolase